MVDTDNLEAVRVFYRELLDVPELPTTQQDQELAMFELGPGRVVEFFQEEKPNPSQDIELSLQIDDVQALWDRMQGRIDVEIVFQLRQNDWGDTSFALRDPAGCVLVFFTKD